MRIYCTLSQTKSVTCFLGDPLQKEEKREEKKKKKKEKEKKEKEKKRESIKKNFF